MPHQRDQPKIPHPLPARSSLQSAEAERAALEQQVGLLSEQASLLRQQLQKRDAEAALQQRQLEQSRAETAAATHRLEELREAVAAEAEATAQVGGAGRGVCTCGSLRGVWVGSARRLHRLPQLAAGTAPFMPGAGTPCRLLVASLLHFEARDSWPSLALPLTPLRAHLLPCRCPGPT